MPGSVLSNRLHCKILGTPAVTMRRWGVDNVDRLHSLGRAAQTREQPEPQTPERACLCDEAWRTLPVPSHTLQSAVSMRPPFNHRRSSFSGRRFPTVEHSATECHVDVVTVFRKAKAYNTYKALQAAHCSCDLYDQTAICSTGLSFNGLYPRNPSNYMDYYSFNDFEEM